MPTSPQSLTFELFINGEWIDVTGDVRHVNDVTIRYGRSDESQSANPASCSLALDNSTGKYSPRNPMSPYFGYLTRNTPVRVSLGSGSAYGFFSPTNSSATYIQTTDKASLSITGDLDVRVELQPQGLDNWDGTFDIIGKYDATGNQRSWGFRLSGGTLSAGFSSDGVTATFYSFGAVPADWFQQRRAVRFTIDVNNGAGGKVIRFYTADTIDGPWTDVGGTTSPGAISIFDSTAPVRVGSFDVLAFQLIGYVYKAEIRSGINGTIVADPNFANNINSTGLLDDQANIWSIVGIGSFAGDPVTSRFVGDVASWPTRWSVNHNDKYVPIECSGPLRRIIQGTAPANVPWRQYVNEGNGLPPLVPLEPAIAYWPLEDGPLALEGAPDVGEFPMQLTTTAGLPGHFGSGELSVWLNDVLALSANDTITAEISAVSWDDWDGEAYDFSFVFRGTDDQNFTVRLGGTNSLLFNFDFVTNEVQITPLSGGSSTFSVNSATTMSNGETHLVHVQVVNDAGTSDIDFNLYNLETGDEIGTSINRPGAPQETTSVTVESLGITNDKLSIGHVVIWPFQVGFSTTYELLRGLRGETAPERFLRVCEDHGVSAESNEDNVAVVTLGPQYPDTLSELLSELERTDGGFVTEARSYAGLRYRSLAEILANETVTTLSYDGEQVAPPLEPIDDDQLTRNDVTAKRRDGSEYRIEQTTGPMSTADPLEGGIGRYDASVTLNVEFDADLPSRAAWLLHLGTNDEARYPKLTVDLFSPTISDDDHQAILALDTGSVVRVQGMEAVDVYSDVDLLIVGYEEQVSQYRHVVTFNCVPASPYRGFLPDDNLRGRLDSDETIIVENLDETETSIDYGLLSTTLWSSTAAPYDVVIGGEQMTVTSVTTSPNRLVVTRSVNGVVKSHVTGTSIRLANPVYLG